MDGNLSQRTRLPKQMIQIQRAEEMYFKSLQRIPVVEIMKTYNREHGTQISQRSVERYIARGKQLHSIQYERNADQLEELSLSRRYAAIDEAWNTIRTLDTNGFNMLDADKRAKAKASLLKFISDEQTIIERILKVRAEASAPPGTNIDARSILLITGDTPEERIQQMSKLLAAKQNP